MQRVLAALLALSLAGCAGSHDLLPTTKRGWGVVTIVVGGAWVVAGGAIAADDDATAGTRIGGSLAAGAIGALLITGGYYLAR